MSQATDYSDLGFGITCIDTGYVRPGLACFYLLEAEGECAIIETGTSLSFPRLSRLMSERGLQADSVRYVIPTHVHLDHAGGAGTMMAAFPEAKLLVHPRGARHMAQPERLVASTQQVYGESTFHRLYGTITPVDPSRIIEMADGDHVELADRRLEFRHTRGHAEHHFCVWDTLSRGWFSGDMFGISYPWLRFEQGDYLLPATTPTQFEPSAYLDSVELLASYDPERCYLTHFGELAFSRVKAAWLQQQVKDYAELAVNYRGDAAGMERALVDYSLAQVLSLQPPHNESELREMLAFDMELNAQGLVVWQAGLSD